MTTRERLNENNKNFLKRNPWAKNYKSAQSRCRFGKYKKRGIKFLMTVGDFKELWFRDKAYLMKQPSIDRIDNKGDYTLSNCRFLELEENRRQCALAQKTDKDFSETMRKTTTNWHRKNPKWAKQVHAHLINKIPCNGSGRIEPKFNSMAELKRKYMESTDREARYFEGRMWEEQNKAGKYRIALEKIGLTGIIDAPEMKRIAKTALNEGKEG